MPGRMQCCTEKPAWFSMVYIRGTSFVHHEAHTIDLRVALAHEVERHTRDVTRQLQSESEQAVVRHCQMLVMVRISP